jgi:hypothetical protein
MSTHDLRKGGRWAHDLARQLAETHFGLIAVLPENSSSAWLNFEAGAISKWVESSNVAPVLFGLQASELRGPLAQFQATVFSKDDFVRLLISIASSIGKPAAEAKIERAIDFSWPVLKDRVDAVLRMPVHFQEYATAGVAGDGGEGSSLSEEKAAIVTQIGTSNDNYMDEKEVVAAVNMKRAKVQLLLGELVQAGYLSTEHVPMVGECYQVAPRGSKYLIERGLI